MSFHGLVIYNVFKVDPLPLSSGLVAYKPFLEGGSSSPSVDYLH